MHADGIILSGDLSAITGLRIEHKVHTSGAGRNSPSWQQEVPESFGLALVHSLTISFHISYIVQPT